MSPFYGQGSTVSKLHSHHEETVYFKLPIIKIDVCNFQFIIQQTQITLPRTFKIMGNCNIQIFVIIKTLRFSNYIIPPFKSNGLLRKKNICKDGFKYLLAFFSPDFSGHLIAKFIRGILQLFNEIIDLTQNIDRAGRADKNNSVI